MKEEPLQMHELSLFTRRNFIFRGLLAIPALGLVRHLWNMQVKEGEYYSELSKGNRIRLKSIPAPRGIIYDRSGAIYAHNIPSYNLSLTREDCPDIPGTLKKLAQTVYVPLAKLEERIKQNQSTAKFHPIILFKNLSWHEMSLIGAYQEEFPGITVEFASLRYYPTKNNASHIIGYTAAVNKEQLKNIPFKRVMSAQIFGQKGIESRLNDHLIGYDGGQQVEVDSVGRNIEVLNEIKANPGHNVLLHTDQKLQQNIERIFEGRKGSAILMDPYDGRIFAMLSKPDFDPNLFSNHLDEKTWKRISQHKDNILNNRTIQGRYSPGSTFKMLIALAGLEEGLIHEDSLHNCTGSFRHGKQVYRCWKKSGHGPLAVVEAIAQSCNTFFYSLSEELGIEMIYKYGKKFGFDEITGIDLDNEMIGLLPNAKWKKNNLKQIWYPGETISTGIGQGYLTVTPVRLAVYLSALLNGGYIVEPRIVKGIFDYQGNPVRETELVKPKKMIQVKPNNLNILRQGMLSCVQGEFGTARRINNKEISIGGKTGTTQVISGSTKALLLKKNKVLEEKYQNHAWFIGYAPASKPKVVAVVFIEHGIFGINAAELAQDILLYYSRNIEFLGDSEAYAI